VAAPIEERRLPASVHVAAPLFAGWEELADATGQGHPSGSTSCSYTTAHGCGPFPFALPGVPPHPYFTAFRTGGDPWPCISSSDHDDGLARAKRYSLPFDAT